MTGLMQVLLTSPRVRAPHRTVNGYGRKVYGHLRRNQCRNRSVYWSGNSLIGTDTDRIRP
ncbi:hypothetical protein M422DRAFT_31047 [Sphaerobolus stellatus SS14]|uniref:Uncharacterized protein n=1 Tax=Sphaerobolus stellatus (strain SS14) TaxID=990650 RepID=A0A0C9VWH1_SPHS4|nr:hypothetical protein M422DRAFT_31047 [Sphaerobolus stellatus SS14]